MCIAKVGGEHEESLYQATFVVGSVDFPGFPIGQAKV